MTLDDILTLLGDEAETLLGHVSRTFPKETLHLPGPDFLSRVWEPYDRSPQVLRSLGQSFNHGRRAGTGYLSILSIDQGVHAGLTFPLWQQRNTVQAQRANALVSEARLTEHRTGNRLRNQRLYELYGARRTNFEAYRRAISALTTPQLLDTALRRGQITAVAYVLETTYLYAATDALRQAERDAHLTLAELLVYQL